MMLMWLRNDPDFIGRDDTIEQMENILVEHGHVALTGPGGIG